MKPIFLFTSIIFCAVINLFIAIKAKGQDSSAGTISTGVFAGIESVELLGIVVIVAQLLSATALDKRFSLNYPPLVVGTCSMCNRERLSRIPTR